MPTRTNQKHRRDARRKAAVARNEAWQGLTPQEQWEALDRRLGQSTAKKQRKKIMRKMGINPDPKLSEREIEYGKELAEKFINEKIHS